MSTSSKTLLMFLQISVSSFITKNSNSDGGVDGAARRCDDGILQPLY